MDDAGGGGDGGGELVGDSGPLRVKLHGNEEAKPRARFEQRL